MRCPLALDQNNRLADFAAAKHVVRGKVIRRDGRVQHRSGGASNGRAAPGLARSQVKREGHDAAAVAKATRAVDGRN